MVLFLFIEEQAVIKIATPSMVDPGSTSPPHNTAAFTVQSAIDVGEPG